MVPVYASTGASSIELASSLLGLILVFILAGSHFSFLSKTSQCSDLRSGILASNISFLLSAPFSRFHISRFHNFRLHNLSISA